MTTKNENHEAETPVYTDDAPPLAPKKPGEPEDPVPGTENKHDLNEPQDPDALADLVSKALRGSAAAVRRASKLIETAMVALDRRGRVSFLNRLAELRVIPAAEVKMDRHGPTVMKHLEIADADWLDQPELEEFLPFGYSPLYHFVLLYKALPKGTDQERLKRFVSILQTAEGPITRQWLIDQKRKLTKENQSPNDESDAGEPTGGANGGASETDAEQDDGDYNVDLLLLTPGPGDFAWLRQEYADAYLSDCLPLIAVTNDHDAAVVIIAPFSDVEEVFKLMKLCGFRPARRLFARPPTSSDTDSDVVVIVARRGAMKMAAIAAGEWLADGETIDGTKIAERLFPDAKRKRHAFADAETEGWKCLTSKQTWKKEPKLND